MVILLLAPALFVLGTFVLWPGLQALWVSLFSWTGFSPSAEYVGVSNYRALWHDSRFWQSIRNTLFYLVVGGVGHFSFAYLFAATLARSDLRARRYFQTLIVFPAFISVSGVAILWALLYDPQLGLLNWLFRVVGLNGVIWLSPANGMKAIVACSVWAGVGGHLLILLAGIRRIPPQYLNAARLDGAAEGGVFWHITLPLLKDVSYSVITLWLIGGMQIFGLVQALRGPSLPRQIETVATYQYAISFNARDNIYLMGRGAAMAVVLVAMIAVLVTAVTVVFRQRRVEY